jgi:hypothetical protein
MFIKKPSVALKSILRSSTGAKASTTLIPINLSILRGETTGLLITTPAEVVKKISQMESATLSPDPTLSIQAPFPWLGHVRPTPTSSVPLISGQITTLAIMQEALRRTPNHKAAESDGVPGLVLKHMRPAFHETLHLLF